MTLFLKMPLKIRPICKENTRYHTKLGPDRTILAILPTMPFLQHKGSKAQNRDVGSLFNKKLGNKVEVQCITSARGSKSADIIGLKGRPL